MKSTLTNKLKLIPFTLVLLSSVTWSSCTRYVANPNACYNDKVKQILVSNCTSSGCHNARDRKEDLDFTTYEGVMKAVNPGNAQLSELYKAINSTGSERMPPSYSLTDEEKHILKNWINNGAPNNSCQIPVCDTTVFTFSGKIGSLIKNNCEGCHKTGGTSSGVILESYGSIVEYISSGKKFMGSIKHQSGYAPMPQNSAQLSDCDIRCIEKWISAGMPNN